MEKASSLPLSKALVGRCINVARYLSDQEMRELYWNPEYESGIFIELDDKTQILIQRDGEGNGPGRILLADKDNNQATF